MWRAFSAGWDNLPFDRAFAKANASVHIRRPKIGKLACKAQGVRITERSGVTGQKI
ncbi:MAG: hypothetical protein IJW00_04605 [Clostridia bacterium]|nr:hypothetical protein [Clostridia bacterium]